MTPKPVNIVAFEAARRFIPAGLINFGKGLMDYT